MDGIVRPICMAILTGEKYEVLNHDGSGVPNFCNFETTQIAAGVKPSHRLDVSSSQVCSPCEVGICKVFGKKTCQTHSTNQGDVVPWRIATANSLVPCSPRLQSEEHALDWKLPPAPRAGGSSGVLDASCSHLVHATWQERCS